MEHIASDRRLLGYCGLYCGACDIHRTYSAAKETGHTPAWSELPTRLTQNLPFRPKPIVCEGCRSDKVFGGCAICSIRKCAEKKPAISICTECDRYPCIRFKVFGLLNRLFSIERKLPHQTTKLANIRRIEQVGKRAWLAEQRKTWQCPTCNEPFSWYRSTCAKCGAALDPLKPYSI